MNFQKSLHEKQFETVWMTLNYIQPWFFRINIIDSNKQKKYPNCLQRNKDNFLCAILQHAICHYWNSCHNYKRWNDCWNHKSIRILYSQSFRRISITEDVIIKNCAYMIKPCIGIMSFRRCVHCNREYEDVFNRRICSDECSSEIS